ncbi:HEAT repeat domain-containing protein [Streptomyces erythrogriseus]
MTSPIETLIQQLDGKADESYDARAELIRIGADAIPAVISGLPSLGGFGQLTAIEVFEEVGDPRCGPALIDLLNSDNPTVREWAAMALASLEINGAVEPCAAPTAPVWNGQPHRTGPSLSASAGH